MASTKFNRVGISESNLAVKTLYGSGAEAQRLRNRYMQERLGPEDEDVKQPQRERILDFMLRNHGKQNLRLLSLPGERWVYERMVDESWSKGRAEFMGLEWNWGVIERGTGWMPAKVNPKHTKWAASKHRYQEWEIPTGLIRGFWTPQATWLQMYAGSFLQLGRNDLTFTNRHGKQGRLSHWKLNTCAWLDFSGNLSGKEIRNALLGLSNFLYMDAKVCPVAITVVAGREHDGVPDVGDPVEIRVAVMKTLLEQRGYRTFEVDDAWMYESSAGSHMLNVTGRMRLK